MASFFGVKLSNQDFARRTISNLFPFGAEKEPDGSMLSETRSPCARRTIEEVYDALAERLLSTALKFQNLNLKYIVGLAGPPGAGKSTLASEVIRRVNLLWSQKLVKANSSLLPNEVAMVLPMDGFHLYRHQLDAMEDPNDAHARRGAPWTFNPKLLFKCLQTLRNEGSVYAPSFDHGVGDPVENDIFVSSQHRVVIIEGNYLLLEEDTWKDLSALFDEKWFIDVDIDVAMRRVLNRHISTGKEPDVAKWRIEYNDRPNAELIMKSKKHADLVISTKKIYTWRSANDLFIQWELLCSVTQWNCLKKHRRLFRKSLVVRDLWTTLLYQTKASQFRYA